MNQNNGSKIDLARYRIKDAKEKLKAAKALFDLGYWSDSVGRSYYAIFSATRSLLAMKAVDSTKHSGVISLFNLHFVKTGLLSKECSKFIETARRQREKSDYGDYVIITKEDAEHQIANATQFIQAVKALLNKMLKE